MHGWGVFDGKSSEASKTFLRAEAQTTFPEREHNGVEAIDCNTINSESQTSLIARELTLSENAEPLLTFLHSHDSRDLSSTRNVASQ